MCLVAVTTSCRGPGRGSAILPQAFPDPIVTPGEITPEREERAVEIFEKGEKAFREGRTRAAQVLVTQVVQAYPSSSVSGRALAILAQVALQNGTYAVAQAAGLRYLNLLTPGDPRISETRLLLAETANRRGDQEARLEHLLLIDPGTSANFLLRALDAARPAAAALDREAIERVLARTPPGQPLRPVALARYAFLLYAADERDEALAFAQAALTAGARGVDSLRADAVLHGTLAEPGPESRNTFDIGAVLPLGGSPAFSEFASQIAEGVEVAAATFLGDAATVGVQVRDDGGDPNRAAEALRSFEGTDVVGVVGFLQDGALDEAAALGTELPLISPTARTASAETAYTLSGADPQAAAAMARYASQAGFARVAVIHSQAPESVEEADAFVTTAEALGLSVAGRFAYEAGATYFQGQILGAQESLRGEEIRALNLGPDDTLHVEDLEPVAVFLPIPPEDVELLAPQVVFFGLDTLAIQTLGTSGWTDAQVLATVDTRHTTGVIATAPVDAGEGTPGYTRFRQAYEEHFQRSLVSPVPALGYDAAMLLLEAGRAGVGSPTQLRNNLERIRALPGATGTFSVLGGRVLRRTRVVRIDHGSLIPIS